VRLVVLGGGGAMGRITVRALAEDERVARVTVADVSLAAAQRTVAWLEAGREKARAVAADVRDTAALTALLAESDVALNATDYPFNLDVMRASLAARVCYADLGGLFHMTRRQSELDRDFRDAGLTAVLGIGSTPGITNLLARVAVDQLDTVERLDARIGSRDGATAGAMFAPPYSLRTILDECTLEPMVYEDGAWRAVPPMSGAEAIQFPPPVGAMTAMYTLHSEVALFPVSFGERGLCSASFKIAFPPELLAQLRLIVALGLARTDTIKVRGAKGRSAQIVPRETLIALLAERLAPTEGREPKDCDVLRVIAGGTRDGSDVELMEEMVVQPYAPWRVSAGEIDTGVPLAVAGILLARGGHPMGAHGAERVFDPHEFLRELTRYGMRASETSTRTLS
jgi:saccharopine dehydrogenase (NAD+, L-lysine-forming)